MARAQHPVHAQAAATSTRLRERLLDAMWDDVGVMRDAAGLQRGLGKLDAIEGELLATGVAGRRPRLQPDLARLAQPALAGGDLQGDRARRAASARTAAARTIREDFPDEGDLATSTFTVARQRDGALDITDEPVAVHHRQARARACSKEAAE